MQSFFSRLARGILPCLMLVLLGLVLQPERTQAYARAAALKHTAPPGHVTIIVLDMSGSMDGNDHDGVRCSAANAYIDLSGPGDLIGVIGLDNPAPHPRGGPHNFQLAQVWAQPSSMDTMAQREALKRAIAAKSNHCAPDQSTPTYDALNQALKMLSAATQGSERGSVILLTDGMPDPDSQTQIDAINKELLPRFQEGGWPIDTIALGTDTDFTFLKNLSNATEGVPYNDTKGVVSGDSPLNIAPFFVDIFALRNGRTPGPTIDPITLDGGTTSRDFQVGDYVDHFDVIAVKRDPGMSVTVTAPNGQVLPPQVPGTFISTGDAHYAIFAIDNPQPGTWQLNVRGVGQFLMDSIITSSLRVAITLPTANRTLPLGQTFFIVANVVTAQGSPIQGVNMSLTGEITNSAGFTRQLTLSYDARHDSYTVDAAVPESATPGSYVITVSASAVSGVAISSTRLVIQLDRFPVPSFLTVSPTVVEWDPILRFLYGPRVGIIQWLSRWPLQNLPAEPYADLAGQVELQGKPYSNATVTAVATRVGSNTPIPVTVVNHGSGRFHVLFLPLAEGDYIVTFKTSGTFKDNQGDFGTTLHQVHLSIQPATTTQEAIALSITFLLYPVFVLLILLLLRCPFLPSAKGKYKIGESPSEFTLKRSLNPFVWLRRRNLVYTPRALKQSGKGLQMHVNYDRKGGVRARASGRGADRWFKTSNTQVSKQFEPVKQVFYHPSGQPNDPLAITYIFIPRGGGGQGKPGSSGTSDPLAKPSSRGSGNSISEPGSRQAKGDSISGSSKRRTDGSSNSAASGRKPKGTPPSRRKQGI